MAKGKRRRPRRARSCSCPTCGSAISCAATRWSGSSMRGFRDRPIDVLTTAMVAPLLDYMPGVRKGIVFDLPRKRLALVAHRALAARLRAEGYGDALIMPRTWKSALAPSLAGIPVRTGFVGEMRFGLLNDLRPGENALPRMVDRCAALALPKGAALPADWPLPQLVVPRAEVRSGASAMGLTRAAAGGAGGAGRGRPVEAMAGGGLRGARKRLLGEQGFSVWVLGGPGEKALAAEIVAACPAPVPRSHRRRPAQRDPGAGGGRRRGLQRFRPAPRRGRPRHAVDRHFRPDQPVALGAAQSARRGDRAQDRACRAGPATSRPAGSATTAACAISRPSRSCRRHWRRR